ncbi:hypothetical protein TPENAI_61121 [Tenacibaculum litopenaei]|uniref:hypothetical protein n=1 Tax=Tenacibaculum litopenaei TaxID=396016 RepID=UPI003893EE97
MVDPTAFNGDGNITSSDLTVGGDANALLGDVTLEISAGAVGTTELADNAVTTVKINDNAVTTGKINANAVTTAKINDDAVTAAKINADVAGTGLTQNGAGALVVDPTAFNGDGNITSSDLTVGGDANALLGDVTLEISAGAVGTTELADNAVTTVKINDNAVTTGKINANAVTTAKINDDAVTAAKINADVAGTGLTQNGAGALVVDPTAFNGDGNITSSDLTVGGDANALLGDVTLEISAGAVGTTELADNAVTTVKINDNAVTTGKINDNAVTTAKINDAAVTTVKIASGGNDKVLTTTDAGVVQWEDKGPTIKAAGKVAMTYNADATSTYNNHNVVKSFNIASVTRDSEGDYQVTFTTAMSSANYIIQLSIRDCGGNCPGNTNANYDDPGITYYDQTATGFKVNIGDSDNGTNQKDDIDLEFMFSVIDF